MSTILAISNEALSVISCGAPLSFRAKHSLSFRTKHSLSFRTKHSLSFRAKREICFFRCPISELRCPIPITATMCYFAAFAFFAFSRLSLQSNAQTLRKSPRRDILSNHSKTKMGVNRAWWLAWSSKPVWGLSKVPGGFDSHALPPTKMRYACV